MPAMTELLCVANTGSQHDRRGTTEPSASIPETEDPESPMERLVRLQAECSSLQSDLMSLHQVRKPYMQSYSLCINSISIQR
jgi:hypothetical protein